MERHFHEELTQLKQKLLGMSFRVEDAIAKSCEAFFEQKKFLAHEVLEEEKAINQSEIEIDDFGHNLFLLGQPMAVDLRLITMVMKINTDLERIGDHAVNIAEKSLEMVKSPMIPMEELPLAEMSLAAQRMLRDSLDAFLKEEVKIAREVLQHDDEVDELNAQIITKVKSMMQQDLSKVHSGVNMIMVSHNLERIGDLANNIAENVIYWKKGQEVRHGHQHQQDLSSG